MLTRESPVLGRYRILLVPLLTLWALLLGGCGSGPSGGGASPGDNPPPPDFESPTRVANRARIEGQPVEVSLRLDKPPEPRGMTFRLTVANVGRDSLRLELAGPGFEPFIWEPKGSLVWTPEGVRQDVVQVVELEPGASHSSRWSWDGMTSGGERANAGIYWASARILLAEGTITSNTVAFKIERP